MHVSTGLTNYSRPEIKIFTDSVHQVCVGKLARTIRFHEYAQGFRDADGIGELNQRTIRYARSQDRLRYPPGSIRSTSINF